jgi:hypothetical protein
MSTTESVELGLIAVLTVSFFLVAGVLPEQVSIGNLLLGAAAIILLQSLVRDCWLLVKARLKPPTKAPRVKQCMCVESMAGITGVVVGTILVLCRVKTTAPMGRWSWGAAVLVSLGIGFLMKDFVMEFKPWRIRRDKDHLNIIVRWDGKGRNTTNQFWPGAIAVHG